MKRPLLTVGVTGMLALGAFGQGSIVALDDSLDWNGVAIGTAGNYYTGTFGMEVWELSGATSFPPGIDGVNALAGYNAMAADGFKKEVTYANQTMFEGTFSLGIANLYDVTPPGSTVVLALAVWNTSASSWAAMVRSANASTSAGVIAFLNYTAVNDPASGVGGNDPASLSGWSSSIGDLVMTTVIPEPSALSLVGLGGAALLLFRQRKRYMACGLFSSRKHSKVARDPTFTSTGSAIRTLIVCLAAATLAAASPAQGRIDLSNVFIPPNVDIDNAGSPYTGTFRVEVWGLEATAVRSGINLAPGPGAGVAAYEAMVAQGLRLQAAFPGQYMKGGGFSIGARILPTVGPPEAVIALAFWNTPAPSWASMLASANANTRAGVIAFLSPVADIVGNPPPPAPLTGWTRGAVMSSVPEPGELALVGTAVAVFTLCRRPRERPRPASRHQWPKKGSAHSMDSGEICWVFQQRFFGLHVDGVKP